MSEYSKIQRRIWNSRTFHQLSEDAKFLWLYILTCPHSNILGLYVLKPGYAQEDLGWTNKRFTKPFDELLTIQLSNGCQGLIKHDPKNHLILIKNFLEHNPIKNPNQIKAAVKKVSELPISQLFNELKLFIEQLNKQLYEPLAKQLGKPEAVTEAVTVTETEEETAIPSCPHDDIVSLWNDKLVPLGLSKVRLWGKERRKHLNARWKENEDRQDLAYWERLFDYIPKCAFLMGKVEPLQGKKRFSLTLAWLVSSEENLSKVQEGFYEDD